MTKQQLALAGLRISMGWIFFWAFIDKLFGLGLATKPEASWLAGGSPTLGFLSHAAIGPLKPLYNAMAGNVVVDVLFMTGLLVIGVTCMLGIGVKLGSYSGMLLAFLMWTALLLPTNNPFMDEHIIYVLVFAVLATSDAGKYIGLGERWSETQIVKNHPILE